MRLRSKSVYVPVGLIKGRKQRQTGTRRASGYVINDLWLCHKAVDDMGAPVCIAAMPCGMLMGRFLGKVADVARAAIQAKPPRLAAADVALLRAGAEGFSPTAVRKIIAWRERILALLAAQTGALP